MKNVVTRRGCSTLRGEKSEFLSRLKGILVGHVEKKRESSDPLLVRLKRILRGNAGDGEGSPLVSKEGEARQQERELAPHASMVRVLCQAGRFEEASRGALAMLRQGLVVDTMVLNTLLYGLSKCECANQSSGLIAEMTAKGYSPPPDGFYVLLDQGQVFYASLVLGLLKAGKVDEAYVVFKASESEHSAATCDWLVQRLFELGRVDAASHVAIFMLRKEMRLKSSIFNSLVGKLCKAGHQELVFRACFRDNFSTFDNRMILTELISLGKTGDATQFFIDMAHEDGESCQVSLKLVSDAILQTREHQLLERISERTRWISSTATYNILVGALCKVDMVEAAQRLLEEMKVKGCEPDNRTYEATKLFKQTRTSFEKQTALLRELIKEERVEDALQLYEKLAKVTSLKLDVDSYNAMLQQLWASGRETEALKMFQQIGRSGIVPNATTCDVLITGLCRRSKPEAAFKIVQQMPGLGCVPGSSTFKTLLNAACQNDDYKLVQSIVDDMHTSGLQPDYDAALLCYASLGLVVETQELITQMIQRGKKPNDQTYQLVVGKLCEANRLDCAWDVIEEARRTGLLLGEAAYKPYIVALLRSGEVEQTQKRFKNMDSGFMLKCLLEAGLVTEACHHYSTMVEDGSDSSAILNIICSGKVGVTAACKLLDFDDAGSISRLAGELLNKGRLDALVELLIQWSDEKIKDKSHALYDTVIMDICKREKFEEAAHVVEQLFSKGVFATTRAGMVRSTPVRRNLNV